jgi:hypothetical protein
MRSKVSLSFARLICDGQAFLTRATTTTTSEIQELSFADEFRWNNTVRQEENEECFRSPCHETPLDGIPSKYATLSFGHSNDSLLTHRPAMLWSKFLSHFNQPQPPKAFLGQFSKRWQWWRNDKNNK